MTIQDFSSHGLHFIWFQVLDEDQEKIEDFDIVMTYANDAQNLAGAFCYLIDKMYTGLKISVLTQASPARLKAFDQATRLVMFISRDFLKTEHFMHELHQALSRQRPEKKRIVYLIKVNAIPTEPFFASLLPYDISLVDKAWFDLEWKYIKGNKRSGNKRVVSTSRMKFAGNFSCDYAEYFAMTKAAEDVLESILYQGWVLSCFKSSCFFLLIHLYYASNFEKKLRDILHWLLSVHQTCKLYYGTCLKSVQPLKIQLEYITFHRIGNKCVD